jgi:hypothetical protein
MRVVFHLAVPEEQRLKGRMGPEEIVRGALTPNTNRDVPPRIGYVPRDSSCCQLVQGQIGLVAFGLVHQYIAEITACRETERANFLSSTGLFF